MKHTILTSAILFFYFIGSAQLTQNFEVISQFDTLWIKKETLIKSGETVTLPANAYAYAVHQGLVELIDTKGKVILFKAQRYREYLKRNVGGDATIPVKYTDTTWRVNVPIKRVTAIADDVVLSWITLYKKPTQFGSKGSTDILYDKATGNPIASKAP